MQHDPRQEPDRNNPAATPRKIPDWDTLKFAYSDVDCFYRALGELGPEPIWHPGEVLPSGPVTVSPAAAFFSYGLGIFEGTKAHRTRDGRVLLFRYADNARRFQRSAARVLMPPFPVERFTQAVDEMVRRNMRFVPPADKGSLYIRPIQHAIDAQLGLAPCARFWVLIYVCPVGSYFGANASADGPRGLRLKVLEQGRCAPGGTGAAKVMGNYAGGVFIAQQWKQHGFDDVLYLDARHVRYLTETSGSNVFVRMSNDILVTPPLDDQVLAGITRDSVIQIARKRFGIEVEERPVSIEEAIDQGREVFCTGTAWTLQSIRELVYRDKPHRFDRHTLCATLLDEIRGIQTGEKSDPFGWITEIAP